MVDVYQMLDMLTAWVDSKPKVRGYDIDDAELRLRHYGEGRIAVSLRPKNPEAEIAATAQFLVEKLAEVTGRSVEDVEEKGEQCEGLSMEEAEQKLKELGDGSLVEPPTPPYFVVEPPVPPDFPQRAFADFRNLAELVEFLRGNKELTFYFDDEAEWTGDPLIDP